MTTRSPCLATINSAHESAALVQAKCGNATRQTRQRVLIWRHMLLQDTTQRHVHRVLHRRREVAHISQPKIRVTQVHVKGIQLLTEPPSPRPLIWPQPTSSAILFTIGGNCSAGRARHKQPPAVALWLVRKPRVALHAAIVLRAAARSKHARPRPVALTQNPS